jgi:hypothetical protein
VALTPRLLAELNRQSFRQHGRAYEQYRVPMLWPVDRRTGKAPKSSDASVPALAEGQ